MPNAIWSGSGYRDHVSLLMPYTQPSSDAYFCPAAKSHRNITAEQVPYIRKNYGLGDEIIGRYSTYYNSYWGYYKGGTWEYKLRRLSECRSPIVLLFCSSRTNNEQSYGFYAGGLSSWRPPVAPYRIGYPLPHDGEPNVLWHDGSVTMAYDNTELGYPNSQGETNTEFWDFAGDFH
jgi:prepilin-type processing-associated H-X9-DG protein